MTARVVIASDVFGNARQVERMLADKGFDVAIATTPNDCLLICQQGVADVAVLDALHPGGSADWLCRVLKGAKSVHAPVLVMTPRDDPARRLAALDRGADECLSHPFGQAALVARIRSLAALGRLREEARRGRLMAGAEDAAEPDGPSAARVLVLDPDERSRERLASLLSAEFTVSVAASRAEGLSRAAEAACDIAVVGLDPPENEGLGLARQMRFVDPSRKLRIILVADDEPARSNLICDAGIDDFILRPVDRTEALGRVRLAARKNALSRFLEEMEARTRLAVPARFSALAPRRPPDRFAA
jgi:DNA-binding response OmpR family regulator